MSELFEEMVCDLLNSLYNTTSFSLYGRNGQIQNGIDIISYEKNTVCQCKLRNFDINSQKYKAKFIKEVFEDINNILRSGKMPKNIIIASTIQNDTMIQDCLNRLIFTNIGTIEVKFWSWEYINNNIYLFSNLLNKYYPIRDTNIEIANIKVLNKSIYKKSQNNNFLFKFQNIKNRNQLPIFDFSFMNNTQNTILLNSIYAFCSLLPIAKAGYYEKPVGILKVTKKFTLDLKIDDFNTETMNAIEIKDPIYAYPKAPFRIQIQAIKPITSYVKIRFKFDFGNTTIITPDLLFNSDIQMTSRIFG